MVDNLYGPIIDDSDVHEAVVTFLKKWLPTYLQEVSRRRGLDYDLTHSIPDYINAKSLDKWPEDQLPACVIFIPGYIGEPVKRGNGGWTVTFSVGVAPVVSSIDQKSTREMLSAYMSAITLAFLQHGSLDGFATSTEWRGNQFDTLAFADEKTIQAGVITLGVSVDNVLNSDCGLATPPSDPVTDPGPFERVETVDVDVKELT